VTFLRFVTFTFWNYYVLKLLCLETIISSDATLSDINVVLCYVLSQYPIHFYPNKLNSYFVDKAVMLQPESKF
jgi:hypothetical protein